MCTMGSASGGRRGRALLRRQPRAALVVPLHASALQFAAPVTSRRGRGRRAYAAAEAVRGRAGARPGGNRAHASDQVETVLYRLALPRPARAAGDGAARPDRAAPAGVSAARTPAPTAGRRLAWREDESNQDRTLARNRLRLDVIPALREIHPAAEGNVLATAAQLRDEQEVLERAVDEALRARRARAVVPHCRSGAPGVGARPRCGGCCSSAWRSPPPGRLCRCAPSACVRSSGSQSGAAAAWRSSAAACERSRNMASCGSCATLRLRRRPPPHLPVPGACRFGAWEVRAEPGPLPPAGDVGSLDEPLLDAGRLGATLTVRGWRDGDRMEPARAGGTKSLQDVFSDRKVPRSLRRSLPVVVLASDIAWVAGSRSPSTSSSTSAHRPRSACGRAQSAPPF